MKKLLFVLMFLLNVLGFSAMKNGIYSVEKKYDGNWTSFVKLTVKDGKIIGAQYDRKNQKGELLSMNQNSFRDIALEISRNLINSQNVSSVTGKDAAAVSEFKQMSNFLINKANNGETGDFKM
ncbi:pheromone cAD1 o protein [Leptotrichia massiliensis]|uniref:pheromone cAD1 o protein n=1 Tax=Leptotrichia massiliensis TaxID=1852388 RepID=UPI0028D3EED6|nr:pheromone cAD1 o protein [Leptotrichia massiliensis]